MERLLRQPAACQGSVAAMTTFRRFSEYVDAAHKMRSRIPRDASYGQVVAALADAGFVGATAGELRTLAQHMGGSDGHAPRAESAAQRDNRTTTWRPRSRIWSRGNRRNCPSRGHTWPNSDA